MAEVFESEQKGVVQEPPFTACEALVTSIHSDAVFKKPDCTLSQEEEEEDNISVDGGVLEKRRKGVWEVSEMAKKKEERLDFCGEDEGEDEGSVKCALKIEVIDDTALICPAKLSEVSQRNMRRESDVKGKTVVGFAEHSHRNGNNKRNGVQESDGNGKRIAGFDGNLGRNGNNERNVVQECDVNGKRVVGFDGNLQRNENDKRNVVQEGDGNGKGIVGSDGNSQRNGNDKRNLMQESDGNGKRNVGFEESWEKNGNNDQRDVNVMQESEGKKKEKRPRRRGKKNDGKKRGDEKENMLTLTHVDAVNVQALPVSREGKMVYSTKEMEALRFLDMEEQKNKWAEVYCGLGPEIAKEYDGLVDSDNQKQKNVHLDFDPRRQFGNQGAPSVFSALAAKGRRNHLRVFVH